MKTYVIIDGYSLRDVDHWKTGISTISGGVRIVIVHGGYIEEIITDEVYIHSYLQEATLGVDYLVRQ